MDDFLKKFATCEGNCREWLFYLQGGDDLGDAGGVVGEGHGFADVPGGTGAAGQGDAPTGGTDGNGDGGEIRIGHEFGFDVSGDAGVGGHVGKGGADGVAFAADDGAGVGQFIADIIGREAESVEFALGGPLGVFGVGNYAVAG